MRNGRTKQSCCEHVWKSCTDVSWEARTRRRAWTRTDRSTVRRKKRSAPTQNIRTSTVRVNDHHPQKLQDEVPTNSNLIPELRSTTTTCDTALQLDADAKALTMACKRRRAHAWNVEGFLTKLAVRETLVSSAFFLTKRTYIRRVV